ncbi:hypothetical protein [Halothiobacillus sp.]|uniref:hypothetical protein n=1 Tax=Halothiobacillus sp. TaxID=1891311 RepID=UPI00261A995C|nr:hypothetical protein [Halothiobacillus sp.]
MAAINQRHQPQRLVRDRFWYLIARRAWLWVVEGGKTRSWDLGGLLLALIGIRLSFSRQKCLTRLRVHMPEAHRVMDEEVGGR